MLLHRCQDTEVSLYAASVVVEDVMLNYVIREANPRFIFVNGLFDSVFIRDNKK